MPKNRIIVVLAILVALLPVLGFPRAWEAFFQVLAGLSIVLLSVWSTIDKRLSIKAKAQQRARKVAQVAPGIVPPETSEYGKRVTDFYPKTGQPGRRMTDLKPTLLDENSDQPLN